MATGPYFDSRRGTWSVQWKDGVRWRRKVIMHHPGWKPGDKRPKPPIQAREAVNEYSKRELRTRFGPTFDDEQPVAAFLAEYVRRYKLTRRAASLRALERAVNEFTEWCRVRRVPTLDRITSKVCQAWLTELAERGQSPAYMTQKRALLAAAWSEAVIREELPRNPWKAAKVLGTPAKEKKGSWTPEQFERLLKAAPPWLQDLLVLGTYTGLRINALLNLKWEHIEFHKGDGDDFGDIVVPVELDKAGKGYRVPMHARLHDVLARRAATQTARGKGHVITHSWKKPVRSETTAYRAIQKACEDACLEAPKSPNHQMRRTFGRWALHGQLTGEPIKIYTISQWMGHSTIAMTERYLDLDEATSREEMRDKRRQTDAGL